MANAANATYQWLQCNGSFTSLSGETNQTFQPTSVNAFYAVEVTQNGCTDTSACYPLIFTNLINHSEEIPFKLFPNPANNNINISGISNQNLVIQNTLGQTIFSKQNCNALENIDVSGFAKGCVFCEGR